MNRIEALRTVKRGARLVKRCGWLLLLYPLAGLATGGVSPSCADRLAVERVYYNHRIGIKPPFEEELPARVVEKLLQTEQQKETVLRKVYHVQITPNMLEAEVRRIDATTRAPEILAELKTALDNDPARFAATVARPIVVERILLTHFQNDDSLHAAQRQVVEHIRSALLNAKRGNAGPNRLLSLFKDLGSNRVSELTWQLGAPAAHETSTPDLAQVQRRFGPNAQILSPSRPAKQEAYFQDLPEELQRVLTVQLHTPGDVSAVIETPDAFLLVVNRNRTAECLAVAVLTVTKRGYGEWLAEQSASLSLNQ